jgi:hypothetical protein
MERRWKDADMYVLFNEGALPIRGTVTIVTKAKSAEGWDAQTATITALPCTRVKIGLMVNLLMPAYETRVFVLRLVSRAHAS